MIRLRAYAKINLTLQVIGKRTDGYHEIDSFMQSVSLYDLLTFSEIPSGIQLTTNNLQLTTNNQNLAYQAAELFFDETGIKSGVKIHLEKNIPIAAGLGGGSADAAAVLVGLNELFHTKMDIRKLQVLGETLGSDIPFCLEGGTCRCQGRGELVTRYPLPVTRFFVLVVPNFQVSTKWVYDNFDLQWIREGRLVGMHQPITSIALFNDLEKVVVTKYPEVSKIKKRLIQLGCPQAEMSGSGPAVFGIVEDQKAGQKILEEIKKEYSRSFLVESVEQGVEIDQRGPEV